MIVVHWNALPPMTFAYTPITNHSSVKGHMAVMKLLCCVLLMPTYIKYEVILMLTNTGFLTLWFWKCFPKISSQSIGSVLYRTFNALMLQFYVFNTKTLTFNPSINSAFHILPVCSREDVAFCIGIRLSNKYIIIPSWKTQLHTGLSSCPYLRKMDTVKF